jgi:uncharacterized membrane protein YkvI
VNWRKLHAWAAMAWVVAIVVQVLLAGLAIANLGGSGDFETHANVGYWIGAVQLVAVALAFAAKVSSRDKSISIGLLVLYVIQTLLPPLKSVSPFIAALHPLNAMVLFTLSIWYARHAWRLASETDGVRAMAAPADAGARAG